MALSIADPLYSWDQNNEKIKDLILRNEPVTLCGFSGTGKSRIIKR